MASLIDGVILFTVNAILDFALRGVVIPIAPTLRGGANIAEMWMAASASIIRATLVNTIVNGIYEVAFLSKMGATPGKPLSG